MVQSPVTKIDPAIASRLSKQRYQLVGEHGGVKVCHWTKQSLIADRSCYKGTFYGIESHGCMQMAPNVDNATWAAPTVGGSLTQTRSTRSTTTRTSSIWSPCAGTGGF